MPKIKRGPSIAILAAVLLMAGWTACTDDLPPGAPGTAPDSTPPVRPAAGTTGLASDPASPAYERLRDALGRYRQIAAEGGWPAVPEGDLLAAGDTSARVMPLRQRLAAEGDLTGADPADSVFDAALAEAVQHFQRRHGLSADGLLGPNTLAALNTPVEERIAQLEQAVAQARHLPSDLGDRYVFVNIPEYRLRAFEGDAEVLQMDVVVGAAYEGRQTPTFQDQMEYVVFHPYWNVPAGIAAEEIVPDARAQGLDYLADNGYEITDTYALDAEVYEPTWDRLDRVAAGELRIRQAPGAQNALGRVKFMFPNEYAIYLHDTPADQLFDETARDFSHGCIRVADPQRLAAWVLRHHPDWDAARIEQALADGERQRVDLAAPIPIYLLYWTAYADDAGTVYFLPDVYDRV